MNFPEQRAALADIVAIPVTPYRDGEVDLASFATLLRRLVDNGVTTITPNGNTSEFYALSAAERRELILVSAETAGHDSHLLVGVGHDVTTALDDVRVGAAVGIRMAMIHQPVHPHISPSGWLEYHKQIADGEPDVAFVLYIRNEWVNAAMLRELAAHCPNVIGIKYAVTDPTIFGRLREETGAERFVWIAGLAEPYALSYSVHGATGFTSGLVNVNPRLSIALRDALREGESARALELLRRIARFEELRAENRSANNVSIVKEALAQLGLCDPSIRPPSSVPDAATQAEIAGILGEWSATDDLLLDGAATRTPAVRL